MNIKQQQGQQEQTSTMREASAPIAPNSTDDHMTLVTSPSDLAFSSHSRASPLPACLVLCLIVRAALPEVYTAGRHRVVLTLVRLAAYAGVGIRYVMRRGRIKIFSFIYLQLPIFTP